MHRHPRDASRLRRSTAATGAALIAAAGLTVSEAQAQQKLNIDPASVSVSGISSGADFAIQLHIAYSAKIHGAGLLAASPYYCARGDASKALQYCSNTGTVLNLPYKGPPSAEYVDQLVGDTTAAFSQGKIDDPAGVRSARIYLFSGTRDTKVPQPVVKAVETYYLKLGVDAGNIKTRYDVAAGHGMVTAHYGNSCESSDSPYINKCGVDVAGELLSHIYGSLSPSGGAAADSLKAFDQSAFFAGDEAADMDERGHVYLPAACAAGARCRLHVAVAGCDQNEELIHDQFYAHAGYNEWAETNNILVIYPQVKAARNNPYACWDWWGYSGSDYHTRSGKQLSAVIRMIDRVLAGDPLPPAKAIGFDPCLAWGWFYFMCKLFD